MTVIVDTLDETTSDCCSNLLSGILDLPAECRVNVFATSRSIPEIMEKFARLLPKEGADINAADTYHWTPLYLAADNGHEVIARLVLENGTDANIKGSQSYEERGWSWRPPGSYVKRTEPRNYWTLLYRAAKNGSVAVVKLLLEKSVDPSIKNSNSTLLHWATENGHEATVELQLRKAPMLINAKAFYGSIPLQRAAENGHEAVVELLQSYQEPGGCIFYFRNY